VTSKSLVSVEMPRRGRVCSLVGVSAIEWFKVDLGSELEIGDQRVGGEGGGFRGMWGRWIGLGF